MASLKKRRDIVEKYNSMLEMHVQFCRGKMITIFYTSDIILITKNTWNVKASVVKMASSRRASFVLGSTNERRADDEHRAARVFNKT